MQRPQQQQLISRSRAFSRRARTRVGQAVGRKPQLAGTAEVRKVHKAAEHVQPSIHWPHAEHAPPDTDDILTSRHGRCGVNVGEKLDEKADRVLVLAVLAHDHLVLLLDIGESVGQVVQCPLACVQGP